MQPEANNAPELSEVEFGVGKCCAGFNAETTDLGPGPKDLGSGLVEVKTAAIEDQFILTADKIHIEQRKTSGKFTRRHSPSGRLAARVGRAVRNHQ